VGLAGYLVQGILRIQVDAVIGLPADPVQFIPLDKEGMPFATLIHVIPSKPKKELWRLGNENIQFERIDPVLVTKLKAFAVWASYSPGAEIGEFRITEDKTPFLINYQDSLWINSEFGTPLEFPEKFDPGWERYFLGQDQIEIANEFWNGLTEASKKLDLIFDGSKFSEFYRNHFSRVLTQRRP
jgi:hypothetical protein